jgi:hypothetical protein
MQTHAMRRSMIAANGGRVVKDTSDGRLSEFASVVAALLPCAPL